MANAHYFYLLTPLTEVEQIVEAHKLDFDELINDTFTESELVNYEQLLDTISAIFVQPIISELTFDDFYVNENQAILQKSFFEECKSSICFENIPDFHINPFQITYLNELLRNFDEVLIDTGGVNELTFKKGYLEQLKQYKNIFSLIPPSGHKILNIKTNKPVEPIDFLILDVYRELVRLSKDNKNNLINQHLEMQSEKLKKTFLVMKTDNLDASEILKKSGLNAKDFDDCLEKLKFLLKKII